MTTKTEGSLVRELVVPSRGWDGIRPQRRLKAERPTRVCAFTLLEVVVAVGIFAIGMVAVVGLFVPVARSVGNSADAEAATNVSELLRTELSRRVATTHSFAPVAALLKISSTGANGRGGHQLTDADNNPNATANDPRTDPKLLFASRDGSKIGSYADQIWGGTDVDKFFEIALVRNETLSPLADVTADPPVNPDDSAAVLAYIARIRWPAFTPDATPTNQKRALPAGFNPSGAVRFDNSMKQVLFSAGAVSR
ncbi:MAG: type II secretion system protein [Opitutus sp.]|nr:type II secretion system protein [Opitutus sp.]